MKEDNKKFSRREFFARLLKASVFAGITVAGGKYFQIVDIISREETPAGIPAYRIPDTEGIFCIARGRNPYTVTRKAVETIGGMKRFINRGDKVLIKVNCAFARPSWMGATTSPEVVSEIVKLCYEAGALKVKVTDNPISDTKSCFLKSGIGKAVNEAGGEVAFPSPSDFRRLKLNDGAIGTWEVFYEPLAWCDKLIGIPTVKTHNLCGASLAMKNWYGFFGGSRARFHQDIDRVISELAEIITPTLIVLDGTRMLIGNGPTGGSVSDVIPGNTVVACTDQVAMDSFGVDMLGLDKSTVEFIHMAEARGVGKSDYTRLPGFTEVSV